MSDTESVTVTASWNETDNQSTKWTFSGENEKVELPISNHTATATDDNHVLDEGVDPTTGNSSNATKNGNITANYAIENGNIIANGNSVSFVDITYTIQPKRLLSRCKMIPPKKILDNVRYACHYIDCCIFVRTCCAHNSCVYLYTLK